jgi:hypothetical protein
VSRVATRRSHAELASSSASVSPAATPRHIGAHEGRVVEDPEATPVLVQQRVLAEPAEVRVLVHEALAEAVHEQALQHGLRRRHRERDRAHAEVRGAAPRRPRRIAAVVALGAHAELAAREGRRVEPEHALVVDEAPGREHDAPARADGRVAPSAAHDGAGDAPVAVPH